MKLSTPDQIRNEAAKTSIDEVIAAMDIYAEMRSLENRMISLNSDLKGTIKGLTTTGFAALSNAFFNLEGQDEFRFKDIMSYWREE